MAVNLNAADYIYTLRRTPFALAPIIHSFYDHWDPTEKDILLSYLVLPLVTYKPMHKFLNYAKKNSSLRTLMQEPSRVLGLEAGSRNTSQSPMLPCSSLPPRKASRSMTTCRWNPKVRSGKKMLMPSSSSTHESSLLCLTVKMLFLFTGLWG